MGCSDYINVSDAFALPYEYRKLVYELAEKRVKELNQKINEHANH